MTPDELDVHEARHRSRGEGAVCHTCESLWPCAATRTATALREAWAEVDALSSTLAAANRDAVEAHAEADLLRGSSSPADLAEILRLRVDAERLKDAVLAYCADDDSHAQACALWLPYPTGTEPACDCPVHDLRAALDGEA